MVRLSINDSFLRLKFGRYTNNPVRYYYVRIYRSPIVTSKTGNRFSDHFFFFCSAVTVFLAVKLRTFNNNNKRDDRKIAYNDHFSDSFSNRIHAYKTRVDDKSVVYYRSTYVYTFFFFLFGPFRIFFFQIYRFYTNRIFPYAQLPIIFTFAYIIITYDET